MVGMCDAFVSIWRLFPLLQVVLVAGASLCVRGETGLHVEARCIQDCVQLVLDAVLGDDASAGHLLDCLSDEVNIGFIKSLEIII